MTAAGTPGHPARLRCRAGWRSVGRRYWPRARCGRLRVAGDAGVGCRWRCPSTPALLRLARVRWFRVRFGCGPVAWPPAVVTPLCYHRGEGNAPPEPGPMFFYPANQPWHAGVIRGLTGAGEVVMAALTRIPVNPQVLVWARETAGLDVPTAATRIGVKPERIAEWEEGRSNPTINQLRAMADTYHRPLAALFMTEPLLAEELPELPDFRRAAVRQEVDSSSLQKAIMRAHRQRDALVDIAYELDMPADDVKARINLARNADLEALGLELREALAIESISKSVVLRPEEFLRELVRAAERLNVTVIQVQRVDVMIMRGFSLGDGPCPIVALNGADWPRGKIFSLLHELAHVGFRSSGLCDLEQGEAPEIERTCDRVAAAALMPRADYLRLLGDVQGVSLTVELARALGAEFGASGEAAVLRMVDLGRAQWRDYWRLKPEFEAAYREYKSDERVRNVGKETPVFYQLKARDLGRRFIRQVLQAHGEEAISTRDLVQLLEVTYDKVPKLARVAGEDTEAYAEVP